jgi:phenylalanyl-tRNA synthetase beta chain
MKVPLNWLREYVEITQPVEELAERMTLAGLEVEQIECIGVPGADLVWDRDKFIIARILAIKPHPNADRLVLAEVDYGADEPETLVTGAPNLFQYLGEDLSDRNLKSPMVLEGATIYDGHQEGFVKTTLKGRKVRGIMNRHMLCSEKELGISQEHEGIVLLDTEAKPGTPLQDVLGDVILHLDLTPNLARCQSIIGVAREVVALTGNPLHRPSLEVKMTGPAAADAIDVRIEDSSLCPRFTATLIRDVTIRPSPQWMQRRLRQVGMRPINNIVDVTNYVMMELGQPLHAFDYDLLRERARGRKPTIIVRPARPGEGMETLDGVYRQFNEYDILITDTAGPIGIGGVMGGAETEVHEGTHSVLLEAANFNLIHIRRTAKAHRLPSEASERFGKGIHPADAIRGARRAAELMRVLADGEVGERIVDAYPGRPQPVTASVSAADVERWLGIHIPEEEIISILESLEFACTVQDGRVEAIVPDHRLDIGTGIIGTADLIEEVARIYGYDRIPETEMSDRLPPLRANRSLEREEQTRDLLVRAGLQEIMSYRLTTPEAEARIRRPGAAPDTWPYVELANPISQDKTVMQHTLLESMLAALASNARHRNYVGLFEIGPIYLPRAGQELPDEPRRLAIGLAGERRVPNWMEESGRPYRLESTADLMDFYDLKGVLEALLAGWHIDDAVYEPADHPTFYPGRVAEIKVAGDTVIGVAGQVHPLVAQRFEMAEEIPVLAAELDLEALLETVPAGFTIEAIPQFPAVYQDIAVVVDQDVPAAQVEGLIRQTGGELLARVQLFDLYRGEQLPSGKKSLAYALAFQAADRTMTDGEANRLREKIVRRLEREIGAQLRG